MWTLAYPSCASDFLPAALRAPLAQFHIDPSGLERDDWLDLLVTHRLQPALPPDAITIVYDFPATQCSLARIRAGHPPFSRSFVALYKCFDSH